MASDIYGGDVSQIHPWRMQRGRRRRKSLGSYARVRIWERVLSHPEARAGTRRPTSSPLRPRLPASCVLVPFLGRRGGRGGVAGLKPAVAHLPPCPASAARIFKENRGAGALTDDGVCLVWSTGHRSRRSPPDLPDCSGIALCFLATPPPPPPEPAPCKDREPPWAVPLDACARRRAGVFTQGVDEGMPENPRPREYLRSLLATSVAGEAVETLCFRSSQGLSPAGRGGPLRGFEPSGVPCPCSSAPRLPVSKTRAPGQSSEVGVGSSAAPLIGGSGERRPRSAGVLRADCPSCGHSTCPRSTVAT